MRHGPMHLSTNARLRSLSTALMLRQVGVMHHGLDLVCDFADNLPEAWPEPDPLGKTDPESLAEPLLGIVTGLKTQVLDDREPRSVETDLLVGALHRIVEISISPDLDGDGTLCGLITTVTDITETREREHALTALLREVSHRSRNLLAIVQSIATQTGTHAQNMEDFLAKFRGRLQALAGTQDLVTETDWRGALLHDLVLGQIERLGGQLPETLALTGDNPMLGPNAALHVGLAMHELLVNAVLHGALSRHPPGRIAIASRLDPVAGDLIIDWLEAGNDGQPAGPRFGTVVLERIVPTALGGMAAYTVSPRRVSYRLTIPAGKFEV